MGFKIDDTVPMPGGGSSWRKYPFADMAIGQSFFAAGDDGRRAANAARMAYKSKMKFSVRTVTEGGVTGMRIWRVE